MAILETIFGKLLRGTFWLCGVTHGAIWPLIVSFLLIFADPLDIGTSMARHSRDLFNMFRAPAAGDTKAGEIAIVIINDTTLRALGQSWPIPYAVHADILSAILADKPRVLVIDVLFIDPLRRDETIDALAEALAQAGDTRIILAAAPLKHGNATLILPELMPHRLQAQGAIVEFGMPDTTAESGAHSPYRPHDAAGPGSIAYAAYAQWCASEAARPGPQRLCAALPKAANFMLPMEIFWPVGTTASPDTERLFGANCAGLPADWKIRLLAVLADFGRVDRLRQDCPPYTAILGQYLLRPAGREETLTKALMDKAVFYGFSVTGNADAVGVPTMHDPLPGAFVHAAAFENLLRYGEDYLSPDSRSAAWNENTIQFLLTALILGLAITIKRTGIPVPRALGPLRQSEIECLHSALIILAALIIVVLAIEIEFRYLRVAPSNWIALLTIAVTAAATLKSAPMPETETPETKTKESRR